MKISLIDKLPLNPLRYFALSSTSLCV